MNVVKIGLTVCALMLVLGASACSRNATTTGVGQVAITNGLGLYNQPANELVKVAASTSTIYLSAEILHPTPTTKVRVRWYRLPSQLISSEDFVGQRSSPNKFDFSKGAKASFLASSVQKTGLAWNLGEYRGEVFINNELAKTIFFDVVSDNDAANSVLAAVVRSISTSDKLNSQFKIDEPKSIFVRDTAHIYAQTNIRGAVAGTEITVQVRYVREDRTFATFTYEVADDEEIVVDLDRERFGKLWSDRLWPMGAFEVRVLVDSVAVSSHTFVVGGAS